MKIQVEAAKYGAIEAMRDLYRQEANCQIIHDSILRRGLGDSYLIRADGRTAGYAGVWNKYHPGRVMEFYVLPPLRAAAQQVFQQVLAATRAKEMEAQTNMPLMLLMLQDHAVDIKVENILFEDALTTSLTCPGGAFRRSRPGDLAGDSIADWVIEAGGKVVASGGFLCHYNPPFGDVFMSVEERARRQGFGSYLVQELKRVCYEAGRRPAARCNPDNVASRRTLEKAGLLPCGRMLAGRIVRPKPAAKKKSR